MRKGDDVPALIAILACVPVRMGMATVPRSAKSGKPWKRTECHPCANASAPATARLCACRWYSRIPRRPTNAASTARQAKRASTRTSTPTANSCFGLFCRNAQGVITNVEYALSWQAFAQPRDALGEAESVLGRNRPPGRQVGLVLTAVDSAGVLAQYGAGQYRLTRLDAAPFLLPLSATCSVRPWSAFPVPARANTRRRVAEAPECDCQF